MKWFSEHHRSGFLKVLTASFLAALVAGCGGGGGGGSVAAPGTLGVSLTDAPACGYDEVNVTVVKVRVHLSSSASEGDAGWTDIELNPARRINLLSLNNGVLFNLGETTLPAGHYTQLRLVLDPNTAAGLANSVLPTGGTDTALVTPSAVQSGIKLINQFDVESGKRVDLVLDFDACKSVVKRGNGTYALKPVIRVIPFVPNGIKGFVDLALLGSGVMVTAQQNGEIKQSTAPIAISGEFFLARIDPGDYDIVFTADGRATSVIAAVPVPTSTSVTTVSTIGDPITLPVSTTRKVSGSATLDPASATSVAYVAAKQSFTSPATTVTVNSVAADESAAGAYTLTLPIGAPRFGSYSATPPIALPEQAAVAGKYAIEASANGYVKQSVDKDISAGDATQDFTLAP
ncbi:MAG: hypothetical protein A3H34_04985 [Betaproteobacteria bacterium RIFCSPLOWO2_02_FULL_67_19]|nr:MAG: hypothetical protein A3H34_04985 [Betaproteobacteria bacterium RIFCSPLOWO2_02_FULL_67_19]